MTHFLEKKCVLILTKILLCRIINLSEVYMYKVFYRSKGEEKTIIVQADNNYSAICLALDSIADERAVIYKWIKI